MYVQFKFTKEKKKLLRDIYENKRGTKPLEI